MYNKGRLHKRHFCIPLYFFHFFPMLPALDGALKLKVAQLFKMCLDFVLYFCVAVLIQF